MVSALNPVAVIFLAYAAVTSVGPWFGVNDPLAAVMFVSAWMLPIPRMTLPHRPAGAETGRRPVTRRVPVLLLLLGALPWVALPWLHGTYPQSLLWVPLGFPPAIKAIGMALTVVLFSRPILARLEARRRPAGSPMDRRTARSLTGYFITASAIFLISGHLYILITAAFGFLCLYTLDRRAPAAA